MSGRQKQTEADNVRRLNPEQIAALDLVVAGNTDAHVASEIGVTRQTVNVWRNHHPAFRAELTRRLREMSESLANRSLSVRLKALDVIEEAIENGSVNAAIAYLRLAMPAPDVSGPTEADEIVRAEAQKRGDHVQQLLASMNVTDDGIALYEQEIEQRLSDARQAKEEER